MESHFLVELVYETWRVLHKPPDLRSMLLDPRGDLGADEYDETEGECVDIYRYFTDNGRILQFDQIDFRVAFREPDYLLLFMSPEATAYYHGSLLLTALLFVLRRESPDNHGPDSTSDELLEVVNKPVSSRPSAINEYFVLNEALMFEWSKYAPQYNDKQRWLIIETGRRLIQYLAKDPSVLDNSVSQHVVHLEMLAKLMEV